MRSLLATVQRVNGSPDQGITELPKVSKAFASTECAVDSRPFRDGSFEDTDGNANIL